MTITITLSAEQERHLRAGTARHDAEAVRQVLLGVVDSTVEDLLQRRSTASPETDFEALADRLADQFASTVPDDHHPLSDEAVTRDGVYGDHP
jgi:antitoxin ParD1/3/4